MHVLVLDTNVVLDLLYWHDAGTAFIAHELAAGRAGAVTDARCFTELQRVLALDRFGLAPDEQARLADTYRNSCIWHETPPSFAQALPRCKDQDDQKFLELSYSARASLLVTKDRALLKLARRMNTLCAMRIMTPHDATVLLQPAVVE